MAIEASKFTEKDELIAKFYTLRAGLSVIAEETEKIKKCEGELAELTDKNAQNNKIVQDKYDAESKRLNKGIQDTNCTSRTGYLEQQIFKHQSDLKNVEKHKAPLFNAIFPAIVTFIGGSMVGGPISIVSYDLGWTIIGISFLLALVVGILWRKHVTEREKASMRASIRSKIEQEQTELRKAQEAEKQSMSVFAAELEKLEQATKVNTDIYKPEIQACESKLNVEIIPVCTHIAQNVKAAMIETTKGVLTEADWANIDLLIFYLETGRADSLKEALQLVDKQRQTDQIAYAIHEASNHIVNTLGERLNRLGSIIQTGFTRLANQIQFNHNEAMNAMQHAFSSLEYSINAGNQEISENLSSIHASIRAEGERIANAEQLNASLLKKANESSDNLMYELRYNQKYWRK